MEDTIKHIPFHHIDNKYANKFKNLYNLDYKYNVQDTIRHVAKATRMICTRYHSLVFSIITNKPTIAIAYAPKVEELAKRAEIPCFKPYENIELDYTKPSNRREIISDSEENIRLIESIFEQKLSS
jgi:polysaccharide pyruvyl transferase WcaK-like protein